MSINLDVVVPLVAQNVSLIPPPPTPEQFKSIVSHKCVAFQPRRYFAQAWFFCKLNFCRLVLASVFVCFLYAVPLLGLSEIWTWRGYDSDSLERTKDFLTQIMNYILVFPLMTGFFFAIFEAMRNQAYVRAFDMIQVFKCGYYVKNVFLGFILQLLFTAGFLPGILLAVPTAFAPLMHVEHCCLGVCKSIWYSFKLWKHHYCSMTGFFFLIVLIQLFPAALAYFSTSILYVGLLVTIPYGFVSMAFCYNHVVGVNGLPVFVSSNAPCLGANCHLHPLEFAE